MSEVSEALEDAIKGKKEWDFDIAFSQVEVNMQIATCKESVQNYSETLRHLRIA